MSNNYNEIKRYLARFKYEPHLERIIVESIICYPNLKKELKNESKFGGDIELVKLRQCQEEPKLLRKGTKVFVCLS